MQNVIQYFIDITICNFVLLKLPLTDGGGGGGGGTNESR